MYLPQEKLIRWNQICLSERVSFSLNFSFLGVSQGFALIAKTFLLSYILNKKILAFAPKWFFAFLKSPFIFSRFYTFIGQILH